MEITEWISNLRIKFKCSTETAKSIYYSYLKSNQLDRLKYLLSKMEIE